jgi:diguanylate cyclase (GGDEF)-like protein
MAAEDANAPLIERLKQPRTAGKHAPARQHPRELLKAATNTATAVVALWLAAALIAGAAFMDRDSERRLTSREAALAQLAFEQKRLAFAAHVAMVVDRDIAHTGDVSEQTLHKARVKLLAGSTLATDEMALLAVSGGVVAKPAGPLSPVDPSEDATVRQTAEALAAALPRDEASRSEIVPIAGAPHLAVIARPAELGLRGSRQDRVVVMLQPISAGVLAHLENELGLSHLMVGPPASGADGIVLATRAGEPIATLSWAKSASREEVRRYVWVVALLIAALATAIMAASRRRRREVSALVTEVEAQVFDIAMRDPLTGLLNRASFKRRLEALVANRHERALIGVVYIDLDRFKQVNDGFGHLKGDELLCGVTERLKDLSSKGLSVARLGGDEFAMIVEERSTEAEIVELAERACACLGRPFQLGEVEANIGGSVGVAICPDDGEEPQELLRRADIAMYRAKTGGRNMTVRFDSSMDNDVQERRLLEAELRQALEQDALTMAYQPFWASDGQTLVGVEALVRWSHPTRGPISPAVFVPIAEEAGLIHELGEWTMRRSMQEAKRWKGVTLAVNISPLQVKRQGLMASLRAIIDETGIEPERLEIEITEGVLMEDADAGVRLIRALKELGCHVALDDFGTGFSSLSYLRRFPFDKLKVDQSFVRALGQGAGTAAIIHSVIALGRALGLTVHAEGVETLEHHIFLRAAGCHHLQGFYFAKPMPASEIDALMETVITRAATRPIFAFDSKGAAAQARGDEADTASDLAAALSAKVQAMKLALGDMEAGSGQPVDAARSHRA